MEEKAVIEAADKGSMMEASTLAMMRNLSVMNTREYRCIMKSPCVQLKMTKVREMTKESCKL